MRRLILSVTAIMAFSMIMPSTYAQDIGPDPVDAEAVRLLLRRAMGAMLEKDAHAFVSLCDDYVSCFFYDGYPFTGRRG